MSYDGNMRTHFAKDYSLCKHVEVVKIPEEYKKKIEDFAKEYTERKMSEKDYQDDHDRLYKRTITGKMGEVAIEILLGKPFVDWDIGYSGIYNVADMKPLGVNIGIKTVEYGKYPIIRKVEPTPEIICVKLNRNEIAVCGIATLEVLRKYTSDDLILNENLRKKGYKTGFYGFEHLVPFKTEEDIREIIKEKKDNSILGYWEHKCADRHYFYFGKEQSWTMSLIKRKDNDDKFYYCITAYVGPSSKCFEIPVSAVKNIKEAQIEAEKWLNEQYTKYIDKLKETLTLAEKRQEELRKKLRSN